MDDAVPDISGAGATSRTGMLQLVMALGLGILLAYQLVILRMSDAAVQSDDPAAAVKLTPRSAAALTQLAAQRLADGRAQDASQLATQALQNSAISVEAVRVLGLATPVGDSERIIALLDVGGKLGWRDTAMQLWIIQFAALWDLPDILVQRVDALLRRQVVSPYFFKFFRALMQTDEGRALVAERLRAQPSWRASFFRDARDLSASEARDHEMLLLDLLRTQDLLPQEAAHFVGSLFKMEEYRRAASLWAKVTGEQSVGPMFDGNFERMSAEGDVRQAPFAWRLHSKPGASAYIETSDVSADDQVVRVEAQGSAVGPVMEQATIFPPGHGSIEIVAEGADAAALDAFRWAIQCVGAPKELEVRTVAAGQGGAVRLRLSFAVPTTGCEAQTLSLRAQGTAGGQPASFQLSSVAPGR